jgi:hypothetical protein
MTIHYKLCIQAPNSQLAPDPDPDAEGASPVPAELPLALAFAFRGSGIFRILLNATNWTGLNFLKSLMYQSFLDENGVCLQRDQSVIGVIVLYPNMCRWLDSWIRLSAEYTRFKEVGNRCSKESDMRRGTR